MDRLPSRRNLDYRGVDIPSFLCPVYDDQVKDMSHIVFFKVIVTNRFGVKLQVGWMFSCQIFKIVLKFSVGLIVDQFCVWRGAIIDFIFMTVI